MAVIEVCADEEPGLAKVPPSNERLILLVDDRACARDLIASELEETGFRVVQAADGLQAWEKFCLYEFDLVITDLRMPKSDGMALLRRIGSPRSPNPQVPVLLISAHGTLSTAAEAGRAGAVDFFPFDDAGVETLIERARQILRAPLPPLPLALLGESSRVEELRTRVRALAGLHAALLICGEEGTGRRALARYIHGRSPYGALPFVATGAEDASATLGRVREGTCYLEDYQRFGRDDRRSWLARLREMESLGASAPLRILISVSDDPTALFAEGVLDAEFERSAPRFRITLIPLAARRRDLPLIVTTLGQRIQRRLGRRNLRIEKAALERLASHAWRGELRELESVLESLIACAAAGEIGEPSVRAALCGLEAPLSRIRRERRRDERRQLIDLFRKHGTFSGVARELGITRNAAKYRLAKHHLLPEGPADSRPPSLATEHGS